MDPRAANLLKDLVHLSKLLTPRENSFKKYGLTPSQFVILAEVLAKENITQQDIANELLVTEGNISHLVQTLERKNLIIRVRDKKNYYLQLTESSKKIIEILIPESQKLSESYFRDLSEEEFENLERIIRKLIDSLT